MTTASSPGIALEPAPPGCTEYVASAPCTWEEFLAFDQAGSPAEWLDGRIFVYMSTTNVHERVITFLRTLLEMYSLMNGRLGEVRGGAYPMRIVTGSGSRGREPDISFVLRDNRARLLPAYLDGPADLVVEVVSDDCPQRDRVTKLREYDESGVGEYWIISPRPRRRRAEFFVREGGRLERAELDGGVFASRVVPGFWLRPEWLWAEEPDALAALSTVTGRSLA